MDYPDTMPISARYSGDFDAHICSEEGTCRLETLAGTPMDAAPTIANQFCDPVLDYEYIEYEDTIDVNEDTGLPEFGCDVDYQMVYGVDPPGGGNNNPPANPPANPPPPVDANAPVANNSGGGDSEYAYCGCEEGDDDCLALCKGIMDEMDEFEEGDNWNEDDWNEDMNG